MGFIDDLTKDIEDGNLEMCDSVNIGMRKTKEEWRNEIDEDIRIGREFYEEMKDDLCKLEINGKKYFGYKAGKLCEILRDYNVYKPNKIDGNEKYNSFYDLPKKERMNIVYNSLPKQIRKIISYGGMWEKNNCGNTIRTYREDRIDEYSDIEISKGEMIITVDVDNWEKSYGKTKYERYFSGRARVFCDEWMSINSAHVWKVGKAELDDDEVSDEFMLNAPYKVGKVLGRSKEEIENRADEKHKDIMNKYK